MFDTPAAEHSFKWFVKIPQLMDTGRRDESLLHEHGDVFLEFRSTGSGILVTEHVSLTTVVTLASAYVCGSDHFGND